MQDLKFEFQVENVKCGGCANAIQGGLGRDARVREVAVDIAKGLVTVISTEDMRADLSIALKALGYPEKTA